MATLAQLERDGMDWDAICDIVDNLSPEDEKRAFAVRNDCYSALVPTARWDTDYRLLLAEKAALKAERDELRERVEYVLQVLNDIDAKDLSDHDQPILIAARVLLEYGMEDKDDG